MTRESSLRRLVSPRRVGRYALAGGLSAATHFLTLAGLVELAQVHPVAGSMIGFLASVAVSYVLQHRWVFVSLVPTRVALPRFLTVTAAGFVLNAAIMGLGVEWVGLHYAVAQGFAFFAIPLSNYLLNSLWTFR